MSRTYVSSLRREQAEATRVRIVEAAASVLARGVTELSVPAVAEEAGVSVATVYRHFKTKVELIAGLREHVWSMLELGPADWSSGKYASMDELLDDLPKIGARLSTVDPAILAAVASEDFNAYRREHRAERLDPIEIALRRERPDLAPGDFRKLRDVIAVLVSSPGIRLFEIMTGASHEGAGETVAWAIRRLLRT
jgi:AcrR family transcriptional regulator